VKTFLIAGAALLATAPAAYAQELPTPPPQPAPPVETTPQPTPVPPAEGKGAFSLSGGLTDKGKRYVAAGQKVSVTGRAKPFVAGQVVVVELFRGSKRVSRRVVEITQARDGAGEFAVDFRPGNAGQYTIKARHKPTSEQARFTMASRPFEALGGKVSGGSGAKKIRLVQLGLKQLAYVTPVNGSWDAATSRAAIAFHKTNGMSRSGGGVSAKSFAMLLNGQGGYKLKYPKAGKHVEADLSRQVLVLANNGKPERIYHTSSGAAATPTVVGSFRFYRAQPGTNAKGMVHSWYFIRGYAIHGYKSVPTGPASHGCLRVPIPNALSIFRWIKMGDRIFVYR
jgi:hypothetical protein